jgi:hypothetical protein
MEETAAVRKYLALMRQFVTSEISAGEFEQLYITLRRDLAGQGVYPAGDGGELVEDLFADIDAYTALEPRRADELDTEGLRRATDVAMARLKTVLSG